MSDKSTIPLSGDQVRIKRLRKTSNGTIRTTYQVVVECGKGQLRAAVLRVAIAKFLRQLRSESHPL